MKEFIYASMTDKFENLSGRKWNYSGPNDVSYLRKYPKVSLEEGTRNRLGADGFRQVRDWCEEQFGNNWITSGMIFISSMKRMLLCLR